MSTLDQTGAAAAQAWAAAMRRRRKPVRQMSPMDEMRWFQEPRVSQFHNTIVNQWFQILPADPMRVGFIVTNVDLSNTVSLCQTECAFLSPFPRVFGTGTVNLGLSFCSQGGSIFLRQADWGPLVQRDWWVVQDFGPGEIWVMELLLAGWPETGCES